LGITDVRSSHLINITYIHTYVPTVFERCESDCGNSCGGFGYVFTTFLIPVAVTDVVMFRLRGGKRLYEKPILATRRRVTSWRRRRRRLRRRLSCRQHASIFIGFIRSGSASRRVASRGCDVISRRMRSSGDGLRRRRVVRRARRFVLRFRSVSGTMCCSPVAGRMAAMYWVMQPAVMPPRRRGAGH